ncbi:unnamed protein product [Arctogadus glacialis]
MKFTSRHCNGQQVCSLTQPQSTIRIGQETRCHSSHGSSGFRPRIYTITPKRLCHNLVGPAWEPDQYSGTASELTQLLTTERHHNLLILGKHMPKLQR